MPDRIKNETGLRIKFGIDPTRDRLHLGHFVPLRLVRELQEAGHEAHLILGTFTAQMGDPSGQDKTRPILSAEQVKGNAEKILAQVEKILAPGFVVHRNHEFFEDMSVPLLLTKLASRLTVGAMMSRDGFRKRWENKHPIGLHELIVPLLQGWDSVMVRADVEVGGSDQLFNFQVARTLQEREGQDPQGCLMMPVIDGTDGRKMSKSFGNCIFLDEPPEEIFGKVMSISDEVMSSWIPLLCPNQVLPEHPMERKKSLSLSIIQQVQGLEEAQRGLQHFENTVQGRGRGEALRLPAAPLRALVASARDCSRAQAGRLIQQGAVKRGGETLSDPDFVPEAGSELRVGKRCWIDVVQCQ